VGAAITAGADASGAVVLAGLAGVSAAPRGGGLADGSAAADSPLETLARGSRTFSFAGRLLAAPQRLDAARLYAFCRYVDDVADETPDPVVAARALSEIAEELRGARPPRAWLRDVSAQLARQGTDPECAQELIRGVSADLVPVAVADDAELLRYCYRVASTVGLMMCGVLGVRDPRALAHAIDLGVAMQLTNICRDVLEDAGRGRVYLPTTRLRAHGAVGAPLEMARDVAAVRGVVRDLLTLADHYYESGWQGMGYIPWRARVAIAVAATVYRAIGVKLLREGGDPLRGRTVVSTIGKLGWLFVALWRFPSSFRAAGAHHAQLHVHLRGLPGANAPGGENLTCTA
jgi:phytoene synthase